MMDEIVVIKKQELRDLIKEVIKEEMSQAKPQEYLSAKEVAELLNCSYRTVMRNKYKLGAERVGGQLRFTIEKINSFINPSKTTNNG